MTEGDNHESVSSPREELTLGGLSEGRGCCLSGFVREKVLELEK